MRKVADAFEIVRRLRYATEEVAVGFSCGKDSAALLTLCCEWFPRVAAFYMYVTPGLSFHEQYMAMFEERYKDKLMFGRIMRVPHWTLSRRLRGSIFRDELLKSKDVPELRIRDIEIKVMKETGVTWFASGQKKADSLQRRAMISQCEGIMIESHRAYPLGEWSNRGVLQYLRKKNIPLSPEYAVIGQSYGGHLDAQMVKPIKDHFPADYAKIRRRFPFIEAEIFRYEEGLRNDPKRRVQA